MKNMKSKVISFRVNEDVINVIEKICKRDGISKNELLSDIVSSNLNMKINSNTLSDLEKLLVKLKRFVIEDYNEYCKIPTPSIIKQETLLAYYDDKYQGNSILVGDDTEIREKDGKFYIFNYHDEDNSICESELLSEQEILDYYEGKYTAYDFPKAKSHHFMLGFVEVAKNLLSSFEDELKEHSQK